MEILNTKMRNSRGGTMFAETNSISRQKFGHILHSDPNISTTNHNNHNNFHHDEDLHARHSTSTTPSPGPYYDPSRMSTETSSPYSMSPWNESSTATTPYNKSPWSRNSPVTPLHDDFPPNSLIGSLIREEGHIYSLAASGDLLYTGSDSKNIRVWKNQREFTGFKSNSGFVKAIVISGEKIFTGHQDGKIRVWKVSTKNPKMHKKIGTLPTLKAYVKSSINPNNYVEVRRHRNALWLRHFDAVSCLSLNEDQGLLYSGSWDKTLKVWRICDSKCLESINAHDDAVNSVVNGFDGMVFTGSADGTVKVWRRELQGKGTKHFLLQTLLKQDCAVTALALNKSSSVIYCGSSDGNVNFWEREKHFSGVGILKGHKLAVLCVATSGNLVFSGSADKRICVWRRHDDGIHTCLSVLTGHDGPVKCLAVEVDLESTAEDQRWIVYSGSLDKSVKVWKVSEQAPDLHQMAAHHERHIMEGFPSARHSTPSTTPSFSSRKHSLSYR